MVEKVKIFYFSVFIFVVIAFIFHINAMGHHHWKMATAKNSATTGFNFTTIGLFTRCIPSDSNKTETCFPNLYPTSGGCTRWSDCLGRSGNDACQCDYLPSTKGIAACTIIAAIFLGLAIIILFLHSIKTTASRAVELFLGLFPLILLLLSFSFILTALILVGSYLSRDVMYIIQTVPNTDVATLRQMASNAADIRVDWSTGLEIIALFFSFVSFVLYSIYVFKLGRSS